MIVAHLDLDAFFASVEELEDPSLREKPLVVGGDPHGRGVVSTANYAARTFGIRSAMSCAEALRRCPHAVFVRPRHHLYREYSKAVWETVRGVVPTVERTGLESGGIGAESGPLGLRVASRLMPPAASSPRRSGRLRGARVRTRGPRIRPSRVGPASG